MREILFRGKIVDGGEWLYGHYVHQYGADMIYLLDGVDREYGFDYYHIDEETVGQYTGLTDNNDKKIFEGDIISHFIKYLGQRVEATVEYDNQFASYVCNYTFENKICNAFLCDWVDGNGVEIIGNIHDNPELLKEGEDTE